jgi:hypothetical protein
MDFHKVNNGDEHQNENDDLKYKRGRRKEKE